MFTKQQIQEIQDKLALYAVKDSQFTDATLPLDGEEYVSLLQKNKNVKTKFSAIISNIISNLPKAIIGKDDAASIIEVVKAQDRTTLNFNIWTADNPETLFSVDLPIVNSDVAGVLKNTDYLKFINYEGAINNVTATVNNNVVPILNIVQATANNANTVATTLQNTTVPKIEATANEGKALATTCRTLIDSTNSNVSKLFELNVVYPSNIQSLTVNSSTTEVKNAFIPRIGGTTGVVNTPHVGYLIQNTDKPDCLIISVEKKVVSSFTTESFVILYLKNDSTVVELTVNLDSYGVVSVIERGKLSEWQEDIEELQEKTPTFWVNVLATADTVLNIDSKNINIPAYTNIIIKDFKSLNPYYSSSYDVSSIKRFDFHYNGIAKIKQWIPYSYTISSYKYMSNLEELDVSCWDTSEFTGFNNIFKNMSKVSTLDVRHWDTSNGTAFISTFENCSSLKELDLSGWKVELASSLAYMFHNCTSLASVGNIGVWNTSKIENLTNMFYYCKALTSLDLSNWNTSSVTRVQNMFWGCSSLTSLNLTGWDTTNITTATGMFCYCEKLSKIEGISDFTTIHVTSLEDMFGSCKALTTLDIGNWQVSNVTSLNGTFHFCQKLTSLDVNSWDTSKVTDLWAAFGYAGLTTLDISHWDTSQVTDMAEMFGGCSALTSLNIKNFSTVSIPSTDKVNKMFYNCKNLTDITFGPYFGNCPVAITIDLSTCGTNKNYTLSDNTYTSLLAMHDRTDMPAMTFKFSTKHNLPTDFISEMATKNYTILQV